MSNLPIHFFYLDLFFFKHSYYLYFEETQFNENNVEELLLFFKKNKKFSINYYLHIQFNPIENIYIINKLVYRSDYNDFNIKKQSFSSINDLSYAIRCLNIQTQFSLNSIKEAQSIFLNNYKSFDINFFTPIENKLYKYSFNYLLQSDESSFTEFNLNNDIISHSFMIDIFDKFEISKFYEIGTFNLIQLFGLSYIYKFKLQLDFQHIILYNLFFDINEENYNALYEYYFNEDNEFLFLINYKDSLDEFI